MLIGITFETAAGESRVAATPETVKKFIAAGHRVLVEKNAGLLASITNEAFQEAGASLGTSAEVFGAQLLLKVRAPTVQELTKIAAGTVVVGMLDPFDQTNIAAMAAQGLTAFALEAATSTAL